MKKTLRNVVVVFAIFGLLLMVSCASQQTTTEPEDDQQMVTQDDTTDMEEDEAARLEEERLQAEEAARVAAEEARDAFMSVDINFAFDDYSLSTTAQEILQAKAVWMNNNPEATIIIEGHCDERGTTEYNLALGDRRANAAKNFLSDLGIDATRIKTISYGEEMPIDSAQNEAAWAKNRRAHFTIE